jgi:hypothetical protein
LLTLFHHCSALERVDSSTSAAGLAAAMSRQQVTAGQSSVAR